MQACIICRKTGVTFSDEHVIPDSIGGCYHIRTVCKQCNSLMGHLIDDKLTNHKFMEFQRFLLNIRGKKGKLPNPFSGVHKLTEFPEIKVKLDINENGEIIPYTLPTIPTGELLDGFTIVLDVMDLPNLDTIIDKICTRNGLSRDNLIMEKREVQRSKEVNVNCAIDISKFKLGLLKIAYEFACDTIPAYFRDRKAIYISDILLKGEIKPIEARDIFIGSGLDKNILQPFNFLLEMKDHNHYLFLTNDRRLGFLCFINLFNTFCIGLRLSDSKYKVPDNLLVGVNDFDDRNFHKYTLGELNTLLYSPPEIHFGYKFDTEEEARKFLQLERNPYFGFYKIGEKLPLFWENGNVAYNDIYDKISQRRAKKTDVGDFKNIINTKIKIDQKLYIKVLPSQQLIRVIEVAVEQHKLRTL
jgi:hypothetical protein